MMNEKALCTARELAIGYGKTPLLSDICLGVQPGQILTLIGPNGAGKSTLLKTLAGISWQPWISLPPARCCWKAETLPITPVPSGRRSWPSWPRIAAGWS